MIYPRIRCRGFSLLEFILGLALFSLLIPVSVDWIRSSFSQTTRLYQNLLVEAEINTTLGHLRLLLKQTISSMQTGVNTLHFEEEYRDKNDNRLKRRFVSFSVKDGKFRRKAGRGSPQPLTDQIKITQFVSELNNQVLKIELFTNDQSIVLETFLPNID